MDKESYQRVIPRIRRNATLFPIGFPSTRACTIVEDVDGASAIATSIGRASLAKVVEKGDDSDAFDVETAHFSHWQLSLSPISLGNVFPTFSRKKIFKTLWRTLSLGPGDLGPNSIPLAENCTLGCGRFLATRFSTPWTTRIADGVSAVILSVTAVGSTPSLFLNMPLTTRPFATTLSTLFCPVSIKNVTDESCCICLTDWTLKKSPDEKTSLSTPLA